MVQARESAAASPQCPCPEVVVSHDLAVLYEIQKVDTEISAVKGAIAALDQGADLELQIAADEAELASLVERHRGTERESLDLDLELKTLEEKRTKFRAQLYGGTIRNPRQLQDLQGEVGMLDREIGKTEDRMLELMDSLESGRTEIGERKNRLATMREQLREVQERYARTTERLRGEGGVLDSHRKELAAQVPAQLLKRYEQIRVRQGNLGLVKVMGVHCPGCRITLPSETVKALKADRGTITCENCGRLLFWDSPTSDEAPT
jgi:hypothetical protein